MLQAHSLLWHYLWVAPNLLLVLLAVLMRRRHLHKQYPVFVIFAAVTAVASSLRCTPPTSFLRFRLQPGGTCFGQVCWLEALLKFAVIGEIFGALFGRYPSLAKLGKLLISGVGVALVLLATVAAAYTPKNNIYRIISEAPLLEQTIYMIECGLIVFLFVFAAYFKLHWSRPSFGIALGLGISACVHLATWALMANAGFDYRESLNFLNMATYHVCVLIWFYYILFPGKNVSRPRAPSLPEHRLEVWNEELERLLHQ